MKKIIRNDRTKNEGKSRLADLQKELRSLSDQKRARSLAWFFKTGKGDYGEGDKFIGITMPDIHKIARRYQSLGIPDLEKLVSSDIHEERMTALIIMTLKYPKEKEKFYKLYLKNRKYINNWDLVDVTCGRIVGDYLLDQSRDILYKFARSRNLWEKRIAIISTAMFIRHNDFLDTLKIAEILMKDRHDLIHKAVGWMLREIGKKDKKTEESFLNKNYKEMPRTMLRYAIEKFPERERKRYLKGEI
ncbi:DNA alkylation repair protein [Candidatus Gottesmanbacteria bacterium]|nr:DNA alkylation repair protein [Candidatus Gottesmanbacteria bacterium]